MTILRYRKTAGALMQIVEKNPAKQTSRTFPGLAQMDQNGPQPNGNLHKVGCPRVFFKMAGSTVPNGEPPGPTCRNMRKASDIPESLFSES